MTTTPMTPDAALTRLRQYGEHTSTWSTATYNDGTEKALHEIALTLAAEVDRLRARVAELEAQRAAVLALHRKHDGTDHCFADDEAWPCNTRTTLADPQGLPEPKLTPVSEHPMNRAYRLGATRIPDDIVIDLREATNTGRPTGWPELTDRDGDIWAVTYEPYDGDTVLMPCTGDMHPMLRRDVEKHFGPLNERATP
ncbi:hypothetical protein ACFYPN_16130 [Streptomyces sp. NPDC005576]|uniref:hypothetical protein n=1 Tax=unclassified Streptomyces TaxID=2593676 RepID=UPI0033EA5321